MKSIRFLHLTVVCLSVVMFVQREQFLFADDGVGLKKAYIDGTGPGWKTLGETDFVNVNCDPDTFTWKDDVVHCTGKPLGIVRTQQPYTNFELVAEWQLLEDAGNSGIFIWADPDSVNSLERGKYPYPKCLEVQVLDHGFVAMFEKKKGKKGDWFTTHGDLLPVAGFKLTPFNPSPDGSRSFPIKSLSKGLNEWNHYYIRAIDGEVRLWVNGEEVNGVKNCENRSGFVCLESERGPVNFKNLRIRELP